MPHTRALSGSAKKLYLETAPELLLEAILKPTASCDYALMNVCVMQCCHEYCGTLDSKGKTIVPIIKRCPLFRGQLYACSFYSKVVQNALGSSEVNIRNETITHSKESHVNLTLAMVTPSSGHDAIRPGMQSGADTKKVQALPPFFLLVKGER